MSPVSPEALLQFYRLLSQRGLNDAHSGNGSIRVDGRITVTPTGACADTVAVDDLIHFPEQSAPPAGASLDARIHAAIYRANPEARAVLHAHVPHATALTLDGRDYTPPDLEGQLYFGERIAVLDIAYATCFDDGPAQIGPALAEARIVIARGHGAYAWGDSPERAYKWLCSLELSAQTALLALQAGSYRR